MSFPGTGPECHQSDFARPTQGLNRGRLPRAFLHPPAFCNNHPLGTAASHRDTGACSGGRLAQAARPCSLWGQAALGPQTQGSDSPSGPEFHGYRGPTGTAVPTRVSCSAPVGISKDKVLYKHNAACTAGPENQGVPQQSLISALVPGPPQPSPHHTEVANTHQHCLGVVAWAEATREMKAKGQGHTQGHSHWGVSQNAPKGALIPQGEQ